MLADGLDEESIVLDLGAHKGEFSGWIAKTFGSTCHAIEAVPALYAAIPPAPKVHLYNFAISANNGPLQMYLSDNPEANSILVDASHSARQTQVVEGITLGTLISRLELQRIDLLKADIEGAEIALFDSTPDDVLRKIRQISVEFHDFIPELKIEEDVRRIKRRLRALGFYCIEWSRTNADVLFINRRSFPASLLDYLLLKFVLRYVFGFGRALKRLLADSR